MYYSQVSNNKLIVSAQDVLESSKINDLGDDGAILYQQAVMKAFVNALCAPDWIKKPQAQQLFKGIESAWLNQTKDNLPKVSKEILALVHQVLKNNIPA